MFCISKRVIKSQKCNLKPYLNRPVNPITEPHRFETAFQNGFFFSIRRMNGFVWTPEYADVMKSVPGYLIRSRTLFVHAYWLEFSQKTKLIR